MDLFILDSQLRRTAVLDLYESLIWTERVSSAGDFELQIHSDLNVRNLLTPGTHLAINPSTRVMIVETVVDSVDDTGKALLDVKGPSLEAIFLDRAANDAVTAPQPQDKWIFTDMLPAEIIRQIFKQICIDCSISPGDFIPFYTAGNIYPADTIPEPSTTVTLSVDKTTLYDAIKQLCDIYDLGFRLVRNADTSQLMFNVYAGNDHTTLQSALPSVIFSPELDNLSDVAYLTSQSGYKNVAYIVSPDGTAFAYANGFDSTVSGFDRRVLYLEANDTRYADRTTAGTGGTPVYMVSTAQQTSVKTAQTLATTTQLQSDSLAKITQMQRLLPQDLVNITTVVTLVGSTLTTAQKTDITTAVTASSAYNATEDAALQVALIQVGKNALAEATPQAAFDGEVPKNSQYIYARDYQLGDLVEIRNSDKVTNQMRVTEQIFISDNTGDRSYPTLSIKELISAGSWYAEPPTEVWDDLVNPADTWASRP